jgi:acyl-CoA reductase-like NAD-dependent aldehyde dehydrogenase
MNATTPAPTAPRRTAFFRRLSVTDTITAPDVEVEVAADATVVRNPYNGEVIASVPTVGADAVGCILERARRGRRTAATLSRESRASVLDGASRLVEQRAEAFARLIVSEAGKTITQARKEVSRAVNTLSLSAAEARRNAGEVVPFDSYHGSENRQGWFTREPLGIIAAITPFNDPLNLVAHKLGPAIAGGNAVILKPSALTPLSALRLLDTLIEAGLPDEVVTLVNGDADIAAAIVSAGTSASCRSPPPRSARAVSPRSRSPASPRCAPTRSPERPRRSASSAAATPRCRTRTTPSS